MQEKRHISLRDKYIFSILVIGILIIIVIGSFSYYTARIGLLDRTFDQLTSLRVVKKRQIEVFFNDRSREIRLISGSKDIQEILQSLRGDHKNSRSEINNVFHKYLGQYLKSIQYYEQILLSDEKGIFISINPHNDNPDSSIFIQSKIPSYVSPLFERVKENMTVTIMDLNKELDHPAMFIACPVISNNGSFSGIAALQISLDAINDIMVENDPEHGLGESGESYLVGDDFLMRSNSRFKDNSVLNTRVETEAVLLALEDSTGTAIISDYRNVNVLSSYSKVEISNLHWVILSEIDLKEAMVPLSKIRNNILIISTFITLLLFIYTYIVSIRITSPLIKLTEATKSVAKGVFNQNLIRESNDEIGDLTESFNNMLNQLNNRTEELHKERVKGIRAVFDGQEIERQRLSRELHDGLGQSLIALKLKLEGIRNKNSEEVKELIDEIKISFDEAIDEVRNMSNDLMPAVLNAFGLVKAVKNQCDNISNNSDMNVMFKSYGEIDSLNSKFKTYFFRIIQEGLNNGIRHASASIMNIDLLREDNTITVQIEDNGSGFEFTDEIISKGNGLHNMRERVSLMNGEFKIDSKINSGTKIIIKVPFVN
ncbi:histidine kinase [Bacteroidota bacterium]